MTVIAETVLGADAMSLDLTGLDLSAWVSVEVFIRAQTTNGPWDRCIMRFNDDAARASYVWSVRNDDGTHATSTDTATYIAGIESAHGSGPDIGTNYWGNNFGEILRPGNSETFKHMLIKGSMPISTWHLATRGGAIWKSTAPITKISVIPNDGVHPWKAGSKITLIGTCSGALPSFTLPLPQDDFNRADGPLRGSMWVTFEGTPGTDIGIVSNKVRCNAQFSPSSRAIWNGRPFAADQTSQIEMTSATIGGSHWVGPTVRNSIDGQNHYLCIWFGGSCQIYKMVGGTYSALGSNVGTAFAPGDIFKLEAIGTAIKSYKNGVVINSVTDSAVTVGQPGFAHFAQTYDIDNWAAA